MLHLLDGPCQGHYNAKRAPEYLRAVRHVSTKELDVLDQLEDTPSEGEQVSVYRREGEAITAHLLMRPRSKSGWYQIAQYRHMPEVDGETLRDTAAWRAWVAARYPGQTVDDAGFVKPSPNAMNTERRV